MCARAVGGKKKGSFRSGKSRPCPNCRKDCKVWIVPFAVSGIVDRREDLKLSLIIEEEDRTRTRCGGSPAREEINKIYRWVRAISGRDTTECIQEARHFILLGLQIDSEHRAQCFLSLYSCLILAK